MSTKDGSEEIGRISKQWTGLVKELFTDADNFGVVFPMDLDVKMKAVTMAATFLIVSLRSVKLLKLFSSQRQLVTICYAIDLYGVRPFMKTVNKIFTRN